MHEMMVAESLLAAISDEAAKRNVKPIGAKISCGELNAVSDEALRFAFEAVAKGTACEGLKLEIEHKPIQCRCTKCDETFNADLSEPKCCKCGSDDFELLPDAPLLLDEIEF